MTVLVIPHSDLPVLRGRFSVVFVLSLGALWTGLTVWGAFYAGRHIDYWVTKADNVVARSKMTYMAEELDKSRDMLDIARDTDKQMRILLGMGSKGKVLGAEESQGGPTANDRARLGELLAGGGSRLPQREVHRTVEELRRESRRRLASFQEITWYITNQRSLVRATPTIWPAPGNITSGFGYRLSPMRRRSGDTRRHFHEGLDIANKADTPVMSSADGKVRYAGWSGGFGMVVTIDHGFGYSTLYGHLSKARVKKGDRVTRGQPIGYMGASGRSTGVHLHYEVWRHGRPVNPAKYLDLRLDRLAAR